MIGLTITTMNDINEGLQNFPQMSIMTTSLQEFILLNKKVNKVTFLPIKTISYNFVAYVHYMGIIPNSCLDCGIYPKNLSSKQGTLQKVF